MAATTSIAANLCFTGFNLSAVRQTLDSHEPNPLGLRSGLDSAQGKRVTGSGG